MLESQTTTKATSNHYEVKHYVEYNMGDKSFKTNSSYDLSIKKVNQKSYDILLDRLNFKINGQKIVSKYPLVAHEYFDSLFPIKFKIKNNELVVVNFEEISIRINKKDDFYCNNNPDDEILNISEQFLNTVSTPQKLQEFIFSLAIIRIINMSLLGFAHKQTLTTPWDIISFAKVIFETTRNEEIQNNTIEYVAQAINKDEFLKQLNDYCLEKDLTPIANDQVVLFKATFRQNINYENYNLGFNASQTNVKIKLNNYFDYEENISLQCKE
jgi:hypothetical protein